jgi:Ca-activated chloride channel family protein
MRFAVPHYGMFFALSISIVLLFIWIFRSRDRALSRFADKELLGELLDRVDLRKKRAKLLMLMSAILLCFFALLRPQWGFHWQEVKRKGLDIIVALDTSKSMLSNDVKPSRLARSKLALGDFTRVLQGDRIGLIAFAGTAFLQCPLTIDYGGFLLALDDVDTSTIPRGGTSITAAIREAIKSYGTSPDKYRILIIITDGEDLEGDALEAAQQAKKAGIKIFCIGIGTPEGELIPVPLEGGGVSYVKDSQGNVVKSKLDEGLLEKIALTTGGSYVRWSPTEFGLSLLYKERLSKMEKQELESKLSKLYDERFQVPLGIALLLIVLEAMLSDNKKSPRKNGKKD